MNAAPLKFGSTNQTMNSSFSSYQIGILKFTKRCPRRPGISLIRYSDGQFCAQKNEFSVWTFYLQMCISGTLNNCRILPADEGLQHHLHEGDEWVKDPVGQPLLIVELWRALHRLHWRISEPIQKCSINSRNQPRYEKVYRPKSRSTSELTRGKVEWQ